MHLHNLLRRFSCLEGLGKPLFAAVDMLEACVRQGGKILVCGNGSSAADAEQIVVELMKGFLLPRPLPISLQRRLRSAYVANDGLISKLQQAIPAISLRNKFALPTTYGDVDVEYIFAQQVLGLGKAGDVVWGISTSGRSFDVAHALCVGRALGMKTLGLTGGDGRQVSLFCDLELYVPGQNSAEIQELHAPLCHALCAELEERLFGAGTLKAVERSAMAIDSLQFIRLLVFDFDGVFTDNTVIVSQDGTESIRCSRSDSLGLAMLHKAGGPTCCILSTERNPVVMARAQKLGLACYHGCQDKAQFLLQLMQEKELSSKEVAFMGNDLNDLEAMNLVGISIVPADAHPHIRQNADLVLTASGGRGAIRELCDLFLSNLTHGETHACIHHSGNRH